MQRDNLGTGLASDQLAEMAFPSLQPGALLGGEVVPVVNRVHVAIGMGRDGLSAGERYVAENSFVVKAEMGKGEADHHD